MRRTVIDIGTNTILMLIADFNEEKFGIDTVLDIQRVPRLGKGVDKNRNILPESIEKAINILNEYKKISNENNSTQIKATATSFIRDSNNKNEFIKSVFDNTGIEIEILSGNDEAKWTFIGGIYDKTSSGNNNSSIATIDIGGGSTEITTAPFVPAEGKKILDVSIKGISFNIGSVRISEKFLQSHPPQQKEIKDAEEFILEQFSKFEKSDKSRLIGVAGTITTLGAIKSGLDTFIPEKVDNLELTFKDVIELLNMLCSKSLEELYSMGNYMEGRADIIIPGTLILRCFMERSGFDKLTISTKGLRYGVFLRESLK